MSGLASGFGRRRRAVVRDDGREFESLADAAIATFGSLVNSHRISLACKTGKPVGGHTFRFRDGGAR